MPLATVTAYFTASGWLHLRHDPQRAGVMIWDNKMRDLRLLDSHLGITIGQAAHSVSFPVLLFYNFFKELPNAVASCWRSATSSRVSPAVR